MKTEIHLTAEMVEIIEHALNRRKNVEIGVKNGKLCVWEISSKTKHERPIA